MIVNGICLIRFQLSAAFQNAFPVSGLYTTHLLSLDALLTVVDSIEARSNVQPADALCENGVSQSSENEGTGRQY